MNLTGSSVLVIGGGGFIGSHLVELLAKQDVKKIRVFDNFCRGTPANLATALRDPRVEVFSIGGDICQLDILNKAMEGMDGVFHLAALWLLQCQDFPRSAFEVNMKGTLNVLDACVQNKIKRLVFSSSASVYGDAETVPMTEDHPFRNKTFYGATKIAGEQMARAYFHRFGLGYVGLRYMNVYGPRQDYRGAYVSVIMKILDRLESGQPPILFGDGTQTFDFIDVRDVALANLLAMQAETVDRFYNVGSGIPTTLKELCVIIMREFGSSLTEKDIRFDTTQPSFVTKRIGSTDLALRDLTFRSKISLPQGIQDLIAWKRSLPKA